ncbi:glycoside hydrolase family 130 protein [Melioribacter sp. OK-6-Me]|uniref:glycoside hydrolase family 130 protein n=1 Tax=unclassified Melioribacter TaxID=2627329 RepID=UPI003ED9FC84
MLVRYERNPIITRKDIPAVNRQLYDVSSVFNPGAIKFNDKYLLILRVQTRGRETFLMKALSDDGINFEVDRSIIKFEGIEKVKDKIYHIYDTRITKIGTHYYLMFAMDMDAGCRLGLARTEDFDNYEFLGIVSQDDSRNGVLFPEKINGKFLRFERPNSVKLKGGPTTGNTIYLSESDDLINWKYVEPVMSGRFHYWDENIGSGPPPIKTKEGWIHVYHGVATHFSSSNIYQAGVSLHDLNNPAKVIARGSLNILEPREMYEMVGQVQNVCFPSGVIVEKDKDGYALPDSKVLIYYGAADTVVALAFTTIEELIDAAKI